MICKFHPKSVPLWWAAVAVAASLSACGGGSDEAVAPVPSPAPAPAPEPEPEPSPAPAPAPSTGTRISANSGGLGGYTLALTSSGNVLVLGSSTLGGHSPLGSFTPTTPLAGTSARTVNGLLAAAVAAGGIYALAVGIDGKLYGWGVTNGGVLGGNLVNGYVDTPREVPGASGTVSMAVASATHAVALKTDGTLAYWPGTIDYATQAITAGTIGGLSDVARIVDGPADIRGSTSEPIAIRNDGSAWTISWSSTAGLLQTDVAVVRQITGLSNVADIACGHSHCLALLKDGTVQAWGSNDQGQLGNGSASGGTSVAIPSGGATAAVSPVAVAGLADIRAIAVGGDASVAVGSDGSVWTWGLLLNAGQGSGPGSTLSPTRLASPTGAVDVSCAAGYGQATHCAVLLDTGALWGWGANVNGELGDGTSTPRDTPVQAGGIALN